MSGARTSAPFLAGMLMVAALPGVLPQGSYALAHFADGEASTGNTFIANATFAECDDDGPDAFGYTCDPVPFRFEDISATGKLLSLTDDSLSGPIGLGFIFTFYGVGQPTMRVSSNGFLSLGNTGSGCCSGQSIPSAANPNGIIAAYWEDLNPALGGSIRHQMKGASPSLRWILQFTDVPHDPGGNPVTFQVILFQGNNTIQINYLSAVSDGGTHSAGIENATGTDGLQYRFGDFERIGRSVEFHPPEVSTEPVPDFGESEPLASPGPTPPGEGVGLLPRDPLVPGADAEVIEHLCKRCVEPWTRPEGTA